MNLVNWLLARLAVALVVGVVVGGLVYFVIGPAVVNAQYKQQLSLEKFENQSGSGAAGSADAVYMVARYDCRNTITEITGEAPDAVYWVIGIYDTRLQRIPGGHLNDTTVEVDENGQFRAVIQQGPGNAQNTLECGSKRNGIIIMRVFLPADAEAVEVPTITRRSVQ